MANTAAHIVDRVIPAVPVRQWVLSLPFDVRARAAFDPSVLTALVRVFAQALRERHHMWAKSIGLDAAEFGAITFVQRFGSSLNLNVHLHVVVVDGVFSRDAARRLQFTPAPPPTNPEMSSLASCVRRRVDKVLVRPQSGTTTHQPALERCAQIALFRGDVQKLADDDAQHDDEIEPAVRSGSAVDDGGYNVEASVRIDAGDDFGREHLLRYCARPPLALGRMSMLPGGRIAYRIKKLRGGRAKVRVMTPVELLARLAALVPPPRHPLVRFHGVFAPRSAWRRDVVPKPREATHEHPKKSIAEPETEPENPRKRPSQQPTAASLALVPRTETLTPNVIAVAHWERLRSGALLAQTPRVDWAALLRRTFETDALECPKCAGRIRVLAIVDDAATAAAILHELAIPTNTPAPRARDPATLFGDDEPAITYAAP